MKKLLSCVLCVAILLAIVPAVAKADTSYSTTSNKNVSLEYPAADSYFANPQRATVKASKANGSIYFMPTPKDGNGVLGTVANGTEVTIYAEQSGFYFFMTEDGRAGWNGAKFFKLLGSVDSYTSNNDVVFSFTGGATVMLPPSFTSTGVDRDSNNMYEKYYYTDFDQSMELTLIQLNTEKFYQHDTVLLDDLYNSLKDEYPNPTYDDPKSTRFDLSGYTKDHIYYFKGVLFDQVIYLIQMFYPTKNRTVCDRYVEAITESFSEYGISLADNELFDETFWFMSGDGGVNFVFYGLFHKNGTFTAKSFMDGESYGKYYSGTYVYQNNRLTLSFYWFDYYGLHYSFISDGYGGFYDPGTQPGTGFYLQPLDDSLIKYYYNNSSNTPSSSYQHTNGSLASGTQTRKFIHGGQIQIPNSFRDVSTDEFHALHGYFYDYYDDAQNMTISLSEVMELEYPEGESKVIQSEYDFLKRTQPKATYATKSDDAFTLSGFSGDNIYYIHYKLSQGVVYTVSFLYPTANRDVCDRYVEQVIESFSVK